MVCVPPVRVFTENTAWPPASATVPMQLRLHS